MPSMMAVLLGAQLLAMPSVGGGAAVRGTAELPGSIASFAKAMDLGVSDPSTILLRAVSLLYGRSDSQAQRARSELAHFVSTAELGTDRVPLPLTPEIWTNVILETSSDRRGLVSAILQNRAAALLYYGLSALDDETLQ